MASRLGSRKFRAYPSDTSRTSPLRPTVVTSSRKITFMTLSSGLLGRQVRHEGHGPRALDGVGELALVARAAARNAARDDLAPLGDEALHAPDVLVVHEAHAIHAELTDLAPAEPAPLHWLLWCWNSCLPLRSTLKIGRAHV